MTVAASERQVRTMGTIRSTLGAIAVVAILVGCSFSSSSSVDPETERLAQCDTEHSLYDMAESEYIYYVESTAGIGISITSVEEADAWVASNMRYYRDFPNQLARIRRDRAEMEHWQRELNTHGCG